MKLTDLHGNTIEVIDLNAALTQACLMSSYNQTSGSVQFLRSRRNYW